MDGRAEQRPPAPSPPAPSARTTRNHFWIVALAVVVGANASALAYGLTRDAGRAPGRSKASTTSTLVTVNAANIPASIPVASLRPIDNYGWMTTDDVVKELKQRCASRHGQVLLDLTQGDVHLRAPLSCQVLRDNAAGAQAELVELVANRNDAARRADLIVALSHEFRIPTADRDFLIWTIGTGTSVCFRVADVALYRGELAMVAPPGPSHETPVHWTQVEAARIAGICPSRLDAFFDAVTRAGQPQASKLVRAQLQALGVTP